MSAAPFAHGYTIEVERDADGPNRYGDIEYAVSHSIEGCAWAPRYSNEDNVNRSTVIVGLTLYGPYGADLLDKDRVVLPEIPELPAKRALRTYRVIGDRGDWRNPITGQVFGFEVALERVT